MCQLSSTRQFFRSTVWPCLAAASSAKLHWVASAFRPSSDRDPIEMMPMLAGEGHARRADLGGHRARHLLLQGQELQRRVLEREPVRLVGHALALEQAADDPDGLVLPVAQQHRVDRQRVGVGRQRPGARAEDGPPAGHVVELDHALGDVERMVVRQRHHAGGELDAVGALPRRGQEHLG
jgi:hypothetical protein